jgi:signal transduction histidine kinase
MFGSCDHEGVTMPDPADLLRSWESAIRDIGGLAGSVVSTSAGLTGQLAAPLQKQAELLEQILSRQVAFEKEVLAMLTAPARTVLDLSAQTTEAMAAQARAFRAAALSLGQAADLLEQQAELLGTAIGTIRDPLAALRSAGDSLREGRTQ